MCIDIIKLYASNNNLNMSYTPMMNNNMPRGSYVP